MSEPQKMATGAAVYRTSPVEPVNKRKLANRENGRKGGIATTNKYPLEWIKDRGRKGGSTTRDKYSCDYFRHINEKRRQRNGWPQGKLRKAVEVVRSSVQALGLSQQSTLVFEELMKATQTKT